MMEGGWFDMSWLNSQFYRGLTLKLTDAPMSGAPVSFGLGCVSLCYAIGGQNRSSTR